MISLLPHYTNSKVAFMCCDLQKAFAPRIQNFSKCVQIANLYALVHTLIPGTQYIVTEQYPKGLGHTVDEIAVPPTALTFPKTHFTMAIPPVREALRDVDCVVLFGIEAHVCVLQTVDDLLDMRKRVFVAADGVGSQRAADREAALRILRGWAPACTVATAQSLLLQYCRDTEDPVLKHVRKNFVVKE